MIDAANQLDHLVLAAAAGCQTSFAQIVDRTRGLVCSIALARLRDAEASEDVAQEVYLAVWRDLPKLRNPGSFLPWLRQITRKQAAMVRRGDERRRRWMDPGNMEELLAGAVDHRPTAREALLSAEEARVMDECLAGLPDDAREVLTLYYREGRSSAHVADLLGLSEEAVRQRLARARRALRSEVLERFGDTVRRSAPKAAFSAAVMAAVGSASPVLASAAGAGAALGAKGVGAGTGGAGLGVALAGAAAGLLGGLAGIWLGLRCAITSSTDARERTGLVRLGVQATAAVVLATAGFLIAAQMPEPSRTAIAVLSHGFLIGSLYVLYRLRLPSLLADRRRRERSEDPTRAENHARQDFWAAVGFYGGAAAGTAGLILGLLGG